MKTHDAIRRRLLVAMGAAAGAVFAAPASAQADKAIRFILPNATGSGVDAITRSAQPALAKALGQALVVDNQPGAGGIVGLQLLSRAESNKAIAQTLGISNDTVKQHVRHILTKLHLTSRVEAAVLYAVEQKGMEGR